ncbi:hypothetical protein BVK86_25175 [Pseudomonas reinekei]|uniref:Uncharacterized protein n=1 Tax=Pseudomonas reinekei TaxID=395598 RepID=A0A1Q9WL97_PSERE|nr:hypothetical protein BVK86_25175 [Pseudomonas reinekei]
MLNIDGIDRATAAPMVMVMMGRSLSNRVRQVIGYIADQLYCATASLSATPITPTVTLTILSTASLRCLQ